MEHEVGTDKARETERVIFYDRAINWYFGGYLKMQQMKIPNAYELIQLLHAMGFIVGKVERPSNASSTQENIECCIEITSKNPPLRVVMHSPTISSVLDAHNENAEESNTSFETVSEQPTSFSNELMLPEVSAGKRNVVGEMVELLLQFITNREEDVPKKVENTSAREKRRKCMSMESINCALMQHTQGLNKIYEVEEIPINTENMQAKIRETKVGVAESNPYMIQEMVNSNKIMVECKGSCEYLEVAMEDDKNLFSSPRSKDPSNISSILYTNLSPIGIPPVRQKTWTKGVIEEEKMVETSSPLKNSSVKPEIMKTSDLGKVKHNNQVRQGFQPEKLRSTNADDVHSMTQTRSERGMAPGFSKKLSPRPQLSGKNASASSGTSFSSKSVSMSLPKFKPMVQKSSLNDLKLLKSRKMGVVENRETGIVSLGPRKAVSAKPLFNRSKGVFQNGTDAAQVLASKVSSQKQSKVLTTSNTFRIPESVAIIDEGTVAMASNTQASHIPRLNFKSNGTEQSKHLMTMRKNLNSTDKRTSPKLNRLDIAAMYTNRNRQRGKQP